MATRVIGIRADEALIRSIDNFASECNISRASATQILLGKGLGLARMREAAEQGQSPQLSSGTAGNGSNAPNGFNGDGEPFELPVPEAPPLQAHSNIEDTAELVGRALWGCTPDEQRIVASFPEWVHAAPATELRVRFLALIRELEQLGIDRFTSTAEAFLSARIGGLALEDAAAVLQGMGKLRPGPFKLP
jgi:hypothetical protein